MLKCCPTCNGTGEIEDVSENANIANVPANVQWFDAFWQLYPRKVAKASALKAWRKVATSEAVKDEIMAGFAKQVCTMILAGKYCPHAATWLNGRRWEDEASLGSLSKNDKPRVIACSRCGDSGLVDLMEDMGKPFFRRCSCARGQAPGLLIPQADAIDAS